MRSPRESERRGMTRPSPKRWGRRGLQTPLPLKHFRVPAMKSKDAVSYEA